MSIQNATAKKNVARRAQLAVKDKQNVKARMNVLFGRCRRELRERSFLPLSSLA